MAPAGRLRQVSETVPGPGHAFTRLCRTGLRVRWDADAAALGDLGYQGAADGARGHGFDHP